MRLTAERLTVEDDPEVISDLYFKRGWTDGLPIIPPTPDRVERMLWDWPGEPGDVVGLIPPAFAEATLEKVAINAVMAGGLPAHLPAVVGALEALLDPAFNLNGVQCTTSSTAPLLLYNGPIRQRLEINCGASALGPGGRSNAVIGRAVRLALMAIGGAVPGEADKACLGQPGKYSFCFGENEEESPWEPYHVERGFRREESAVTVVGATGIMEVMDASSKGGEGVLKTMARSMTSAGFMAASNYADGAEALVVFTPEHARRIADAGFSRAAARAWLWREARLSLQDFSPEMSARIEEWQRSVGVFEDGRVHVTKGPEDLLVVVAGGAGSKSAFIPAWCGTTRSAIRRISTT